MDRRDLEQANRNLMALRAQAQGTGSTLNTSGGRLHQQGKPRRQYPARESGEGRTGRMTRMGDDLPSLMASYAATRARHEERRRIEREQEERDRAAYTGECYDCRDTGWKQGELNEPCSCPLGRAIREERRMAQFREIWRDAQIPPRQQDFSLATYPAKHLEAYAAVRDFLGEWNGQRGLLLVGPYSTGKTGLMVSLMREAADIYAGSSRRMRFMASVELMQAMRPTGGHDAPEGDAIFERLMRTSLLGLDDIGKDKPSTWVLDRLFTLFNYRYNHKLPTFATTNFDIDVLVDRVGQGVVDRLLEMCDWIEMDADAPNLRRMRAGS